MWVCGHECSNILSFCVYTFRLRLVSDSTEVVLSTVLPATQNHLSVYLSPCILSPNYDCDSFTSLSHWSLLFCYFLEPPASIVIYTVKYVGCDLIPYIPAQIRAVSVQDYPGNSCNAASPQLISLWGSEESWVIHQHELPKLQCIIPS